MKDYSTSTVEGAAGWANFYSAPFYDEYDYIKEGRIPEDPDDPTDCNCHDPGCVVHPD
jgi:hypothetical protein